MNVLLQLLLVAVLLLHPDDAAGQFTAAPPTCPDTVSTFNCTVAGDNTSITTWRVGGSSECTLLHRNAGVASTCGLGNAFTATPETGFGTAATLFSSTLTVTVTTALNGTLIECFGPGSGGDLGNRIGGSTIRVIGPPSAPTLSCDLSEDTNGTVNVTVSWTLSDGNSTDFYLINITTQPPSGGPLNITTTNITQRELTDRFQAGYEYNITVRGVNCRSQEGDESGPLTITPQVPMTPSVTNVSADYNGTIGTLQTIETTWNEVDPVTVSVDCMFGQDIDYEVVYTSSSGIFNTTCVVNGMNCNDSVCCHVLQNNITDSRCDPPVPQFNSESVNVTVAARNIVGRSNPTTLMTPVPSVCAEYDRTTGTLQTIDSTWNETENTASYNISYTSSSGTSITTCVVDRVNCSDGVCRHELQNNTADSKCQPPVPQFNNENVTVTVTVTVTAGDIISSVSRDISSMTVVIVDVDSTSIGNTFVECTFEPGYTCTIDYGTDASFSNLNYNGTSTTPDRMSTITLSQGIEINTTYYFIVTAESNSQCARVRGSFRTNCTESDLGVTDFQDVMDTRCANRSSLPIPNGVVCYNGTTATSLADYICNGSFSLSGASQRECQRDGFWTGETPQCTGVVVEPVVDVVAPVVGGVVGGVVVVVVPDSGAVIVILLIIVMNFKSSKGLIIAMVVLLCLSLIGIPLAIMIAVWFFKKTVKCVKWFVIVMIVLFCLSVIWIPLAIMIAVWFFKKTDKGNTEDTDGGHELNDVTKKEEEQYSTLQHGKTASPVPLLTSDQTYAQLGEHDEAAGDVYSHTRHDVMPHAVPNPDDPNYSHFKEGEGGGKGGGGAQEEYSPLQHSKPPRAVPNPNDPSYSHLKQGTQGASRPSADELQYDVVANAPRYTPSQKEKEEGKGKGKRQK